MTLEELLNKLIEKGWKPFKWKDIKRANNEWWFVCFVHKSKKRPWLSDVSHRELVSKESWLWQFVCNNKLQNTTDWEYERRLKKASDCWWDGSEYNTKNDGWYEYRIIESALKDESELEDFLLNSIKLD